MKKIPVTIVSGFLGAGKTTLINQILEHTAVPKEEIVIIENEFGEAGLDHEFLIHSEDQIYQMNNGCICCSLRSDLMQGFHAILEVFAKKDRPVQHVIIESTGIADPQPIIQTIMTDAITSKFFFIDSILTVVDALNYQMELRESEEANKQILMADRIVLSKVEESTDLEALKGQLKGINPLADFRELSMEVPFSEKDFFDLKLFGSTDKVMAETDHHEHEEHHHDHLHHAYKSLQVQTDQPLDEQLLGSWVQWLMINYEAKLYRFKGIIQVKDRENAVMLQGVNQQYGFQLSKKPAQKIETKIVLIGKELPEEEIRQTFAELVKRSK